MIFFIITTVLLSFIHFFLCLHLLVTHILQVLIWWGKGIYCKNHYPSTSWQKFKFLKKKEQFTKFKQNFSLPIIKIQTNTFSLFKHKNLGFSLSCILLCFMKFLKSTFTQCLILLSISLIWVMSRLFVA